MQGIDTGVLVTPDERIATERVDDKDFLATINDQVQINHAVATGVLGAEYQRIEARSGERITLPEERVASRLVDDGIERRVEREVDGKRRIAARDGGQVLDIRTGLTEGLAVERERIAAGEIDGCS